MKYMTTDDIRSTFLNYYQQAGHSVVPSASLLPRNDPTLLFTNAGMVPFKEVFLGTEKRPYQRAVSSQRCVRAGGKHNDLEQVGYTKRHHTFFEMLGNFSFGDYFKREAIASSWHFLTQVLQLPVENLWITVYEDDDESEAIWLNEIGVDPARLSRCGAKDNFWSMGDTGPCGPCSEIFYDHGPEIAGGPPGSPDEDGDRYVEIWNLVFMEFNRDIHGDLTPLPKPCVDTGMGLERIATVMQGVHDNYEIDLFKYLLAVVSEVTGCDDFTNTSLRVIADHIRSCSFLIADGVVPSNEGRGYVLRRIIRRAIRHGHHLGVNEPFFYQLVDGLVSVMAGAYPLLGARQALIEKLLQQEEALFINTLEKGLKVFDQKLQKLKGNVIPGEIVFLLYDTYGFPPDLTADIAREHQLTIDVAGFEQAMQRQREQSQATTQFKLDEIKQLHIAEESVFTGYETLSTSATITSLIDCNNHPVEALRAGDSGIVVLNQSPFYAESGGQVGDKGLLIAEGVLFEVSDTQALGGAILHLGQVKEGELTCGMQVEAQVDQVRQAIRCNHSATHLLHQALQQVLGPQVMQKGSLVDAAHLRFDFSYTEALTDQHITMIENLVNEAIRSNVKVTTSLSSLEQAQQQGAMALFDEKYMDEVRVVTMGGFSKEVCGGTHVTYTGEIGCFKITSQAACAAGVRRIDAVTAAAAVNLFQAETNRLNQISQLLKVKPSAVVLRLSSLLDENKKLHKQLEQVRQKDAHSIAANLAAQAVVIGDIQVVSTQVADVDRNALRQMVDQLKQQLGDAVVLLASVVDDKVILAAGVSSSCTQQIKAGELLNFVAQQIGGKGGGRAEFAQGGGDNVAALSAALASVTGWLQEKL